MVFGVLLWLIFWVFHVSSRIKNRFLRLNGLCIMVLGNTVIVFLLMKYVLVESSIDSGSQYPSICFSQISISIFVGKVRGIDRGIK